MRGPNSRNSRHARTVARPADAADALEAGSLSGRGAGVKIGEAFSIGDIERWPSGGCRASSTKALSAASKTSSASSATRTEFSGIVIAAPHRRCIQAGPVDDIVRSDLRRPIRHLPDWRRRDFSPRRRTDAGAVSLKRQRPFIMSGASMVSIERMARVDPANTWFQLYAARDRSISDDFLRRARDAGFGTLMLTVDNPVLPKRERDMRNGFRLPPKLGLSDKLEALAASAVGDRLSARRRYAGHGNLGSLRRVRR